MAPKKSDTEKEQMIEFCAEWTNEIGLTKLGNFYYQ